MKPNSSHTISRFVNHAGLLNGMGECKVRSRTAGPERETEDDLAHEQGDGGQ